MRLTLGEFIVVRIAEDLQQSDATAAAAREDAGQIKTAYDHRAAPGTLSALVETHEPDERTSTGIPQRLDSSAAAAFDQIAQEISDGAFPAHPKSVGVLVQDGLRTPINVRNGAAREDHPARTGVAPVEGRERSTWTR